MKDSDGPFLSSFLTFFGRVKPGRHHIFIDRAKRYRHSGLLKTITTYELLSENRETYSYTPETKSLHISFFDLHKTWEEVEITDYILVIEEYGDEGAATNNAPIEQEINLRYFKKSSNVYLEQAVDALQFVEDHAELLIDSVLNIGQCWLP
jgi:hypothetical protein